MNNQRTLVTLFLVIVIVVGITTSCATVQKTIIDGETVLQMQQNLFQDLTNSFMEHAGNNDSNIRNGGNLLVVDDHLYFLSQMDFGNGDVQNYLQTLPLSLIGSTTYRNEIVASLDGLLIGAIDHYIFYINKEDYNTLYSLDLKSFEQKQRIALPITSARIYDNQIFISDALEGKLQYYSFEDGKLSEPITLAINSGELMSVCGSNAYMLDTTTGSSVLRRVNIVHQNVAEKVVLKSIKNLQVSGSYYFYLDGKRLYRRRFGSNTAVIALHRDIDEYVIGHTILAFTNSGGGISISQLDGSNITKISEDKATHLQLFNNLLFYQNAYDDNNLYVIDLQEGGRTAVQGFSLTDGGVQFVEVPQKDTTSLPSSIEENLFAMLEKKSHNSFYSGKLFSSPIFIEQCINGNIAYYRHKADTSDLSKIDSVIVITPEQTVVGQYTDGSTAYRQDWNMTLFALGDATPLVTFPVAGRPPSAIKEGEGDRYGLFLSWHQKALDMRNLMMYGEY